MKRYLIVLLALLISVVTYSQTTYNVTVRDNGGYTVTEYNATVTTNTNDYNDGNKYWKLKTNNTTTYNKPVSHKYNTYKPTSTKYYYQGKEGNYLFMCDKHGGSITSVHTDSFNKVFKAVFSSAGKCTHWIKIK